MPREPQGGPHEPRRSVEWRDPRRMPAHPRDEDVRMDRRDRELFHDMPSVTNRTFGQVDAGDGFGYAGQGGYGQDLRMGGYRGVGPKDSWQSDERIQDEMHVRLTDAACRGEHRVTAETVSAFEQALRAQTAEVATPAGLARLIGARAVAN